MIPARGGQRRSDLSWPRAGRGDRAPFGRPCWRPYHVALSMLVEQTYSLFGGVLLLDAHFHAPPPPRASGRARRDLRIDVVLGDNHRRGLRRSPGRLRPSAGLSRRGPAGFVANQPYAGGFHNSALRPPWPGSPYAANRAQSGPSTWMRPGTQSCRRLALRRALIGGPSQGKSVRPAHGNPATAASGRRIGPAEQALQPKKRGRDKHGPEFREETPKTGIQQNNEAHRGGVCLHPQEWCTCEENARVKNVRKYTHLASRQIMQIVWLFLQTHQELRVADLQRLPKLTPGSFR